MAIRSAEARYIRSMSSSPTRRPLQALLTGIGSLRIDPSRQLAAFRQRIAREDEDRRIEVLRSLYLASLMEQASTKRS